MTLLTLLFPHEDTINVYQNRVKPCPDGFMAVTGISQVARLSGWRPFWLMPLLNQVMLMGQLRKSHSPDGKENEANVDLVLRKEQEDEPRSWDAYPY